MITKLKQQVQAGFTLVELLIVVIILAILAAIVIPQFSSSTTDAQESALDANLTAMRSAVELFKVQHNNIYPSAVSAATAGSPACAATVGTGAINTAQAFMDHLLLASDAAGHTCSVSDGTTYRYGPYIRKGIPADPITGSAAVAIPTTTGAPLAPAAATGGWAFDNKSGQIVMNSNANDSKGKAYSTH